jgi:hypothetical protein
MSTPTSNHPENDPHSGLSNAYRAEAEINYPKVIAVGVVSLVIFALCTVWAAKILGRETARMDAETGAARPGKDIGKDEIGIVDQVPFIVDHRLQLWREEHHAKLNGYGWVDRGKGIAHVPIEKAMDAVAAGAQPMGAPK